MRPSKSFEDTTAALKSRTVYLSELSTLCDRLAEQIDAAVASVEAAGEANEIEHQLARVEDLFANIEKVEALARDAIAQLTTWIIEAERRDAETSTARLA